MVTIILYIIIGLISIFIILGLIGTASLIFSKEKDKSLAVIATKDVFKYAFLLIFLLFIFYYVYPTPYLYTHSKETLVKVNRLTGETTYFRFNEGWVKPENSDLPE
ncbi:hypothetical protein MMB75_25650 [Paenibacillus sp. P2(2022)]|uniref:hypothetical protein n=1 Tax=Paenibacillus sp. P2(2022) TaxID=2917813 RepID=UPI002405AFBE|nr:hypothetical protein [Paenibacillus sp. P2(2022)]MDG0057015.1 hypothetical protein [Paenibacillus sp. P2(2022)]